jgi:hypothetical protein
MLSGAGPFYAACAPFGNHPELRSTPQCRFYVQGSPKNLGPRGLHPRRADFQISSSRLSLRYFDRHTNRLPHIPKFRTSSKSPVCGERSVKPREVGRIDFRTGVDVVGEFVLKLWDRDPLYPPIPSFRTRDARSGIQGRRRNTSGFRVQCFRLRSSSFGGQVALPRNDERFGCFGSLRTAGFQPACDVYSAMPVQDEADAGWKPAVLSCPF